MACVAALVPRFAEPAIPALQDTLGSYALTLIDSLDSIALMGGAPAAATASGCVTSAGLKATFPLCLSTLLPTVRISFSEIRRRC